MIKRSYGAVAVVIVLAVTGCAKRTPPVTSPPSAPAPAGAPAPAAGARRVLEVREGLASFYAQEFQGRTTASGGKFDNRELVAAHPSYPFGSLVRVTNLTNRRSVLVVIVDRGPAAFAGARGVIIDLSRAAAERLDFVQAGRTRVRVEVLRRGD
jgi:rare lipoprotein A